MSKGSEYSNAYGNLVFQSGCILGGTWKLKEEVLAEDLIKVEGTLAEIRHALEKAEERLKECMEITRKSAQDKLNAI